ncbi:hypothetical protein LXA43DRAFT_571479 [Ganoderma leucocontextum]|nr:hypothetical protein LXA43DRAFT_571479 [Ganoderma leucocontextum]
MATPDEAGVPFSFFVELVNAIADTKPHKATEKQPRNARYVDSPAYNTFKRWLTALRERYPPLPADTTTIVFRLLFPDEDIGRKYGMQETRLAQHLTKVLAVSSDTEGRGERLRNWKEEDALGCLGNEVFTVMSATAHSQSSTTSVSLRQVDTLLAELASKCAFSDASVRAPFSAATPRRTREAILTTLFASLTPAEGAVLTQIILKDLRPLLSPIPRFATHYTAALLQYKSNAVTMLTKEAAMHAWDPTGRMSQIFKSRANLEETTRTYESLQPGDALPEPEFGTPIQIPKCVKGQGTAQALRALKGADKVWVETKYDGERAQIHVRLDEDGLPRITIFSKSGRDSTLDRAGIHTIICDALGVPRRPSMSTRVANAPGEVAPAFAKDTIIEAEMVAFSEVLGRIDEFWRIRSLIGSTAMGVRHKTLPPPPSSDCGIMESQQSLISNGSDGGTRHLALVFFDVLLLDGVSLLSLPYSERRRILEGTIRVTPGYAMLAARICIDMTRLNADQSCRTAFSSLIADRQEGAVLKADGATYNERRWPWVKLKRDYIPNYGDTVDLVLLGASWEKDRARELRVPPTTYTTFYFATLANADIVQANPSHAPHFEVIITSSYGLSREELEELNFMIKSSDPLSPRPQGTKGLPYTYTLSPNLSPPIVLVQQPFLAELFGAGFSKAPGSMVYELRFPRISKVYRPSDRPWMDGMCLSEYQQIARVAVGRDRPGKAEDDWVKGVFRPNQPPSPGVRCPQKRKEMETEWIEKLAAVDKKSSARGSPTKRARVRSPGPRRTSTNVENMAHGQSGGGTDKLGVVKSPNPRTGLARLGSVTNIAASHSHKTPSPPSTPCRALQDVPLLPSTPRLPASAHGLRTPQSSPLHKTLQPHPTSSGSPHGTIGKTDTEAIRDDPPTSPLHAVSPERIDAPSYRPPSSLSTLHQYLQDAVVWMARPPGTPRPLWRAPSRSVIPIGNQVNSLDAVTLACGWDSAMPCSWAKRGVVFVDDSEATSAYTAQVLGQLAKRRATLLEEDKERDCRPIFVFSTKMLAYDTLDRAMTREELEARAICRFG